MECALGGADASDRGSLTATGLAAPPLHPAAHGGAAARALLRAPPVTGWPLVEPGNSVVPGFLVDMRVDLHRGRDMSKPEDHLGVTGRHEQLLTGNRQCSSLSNASVRRTNRGESVLVDAFVVASDASRGLLLQRRWMTHRAARYNRGGDTAGQRRFRTRSAPPCAGWPVRCAAGRSRSLVLPNDAPCATLPVLRSDAVVCRR
jgi:hypothetical protein